MSQFTNYVTATSIGAVTTLTGDAGGAIAPDGAGNITLAGGTNIGTVGAGNTITFNLEATIPVTLGGTGLITITDHAVLLGSGAGAITPLVVGTTGNVLTGVTGADPAWAQVDLASMVTGILTVPNGGTGLATITDHGILLGSGVNAVTPLGVAGNGEIPIGSAGADPVLGTITAGTGVGITNAAGSITVNAAGVDQVNIFYVGKHGNDGNDGLTINKAFLTFGAAITAASSGDTVWCSDDGLYTENITGAAGISIFAPNATLAGAHTITTNNSWKFKAMTVATGVTGVTMNTASQEAHIEVEDFTMSGTGIGILCLAGRLFCNTGHVIIENGFFVGSTTADETYVVFDEIAITGTASAFGAIAGGELQVRGTCIENSGAGNGTAFFTTGGGAPEINAIVTHIHLDILSNITAGSSVFITSSALHGTLAESGAGTVMMGGATRIDAVPIGAVTPSTGAFTTLSATTPIAVASGGTGLATITDHGILVGSGAADITALAVGATGETIMGSTGADPGWTASPSFGGSVTAQTDITATAGDINIFAGSLDLAITSSAAIGLITKLDGASVERSFLHTYGDAGGAHGYNTFLGSNAGNFTLTTGTSRFNTALGAGDLGGGKGVLHALTTGERNTALGYSTMLDLTTGATNVAVGMNALQQLVSGDHNVCIGSGAAGYAYTGAESSNICISNIGIIADANTIRIGTDGSGAGQQDTTYVAGIYGVTPAGTLNVALVDSNHQLGSVASVGVANGGTGLATITDHGVMVGSGTGAITPLAVGATGETIMGSTGADPGWTASPSFGGTVTAATGMTITANDLAIVSGKLTMPATSATDGYISIDGNYSLHTYGTGNSFGGDRAGNQTLTTGSSQYNAGFGTLALFRLTTGDRNSALGYGTLAQCTEGQFNSGQGSGSFSDLTTGSYCTGIGNGALANMVTGDYNTSLGYNSGSELTTNDSDNIMIGNIGTAGDNNKIIIGTQGSGANQQDSCQIAGIYGVTPGGTLNVALVDSNHQLGSVAALGVANGGTGAATFTDGGVLVGATTGAIEALGVGTNGQVLVGSTAANPVFATITDGPGIGTTLGAGALTISNETTINNQTGTTYTLVIGDAFKYITFSNAAAIACTIPTNAAVALPIGTQIGFQQLGAGQLTFSGAGTTLQSADTALTTVKQYSVGYMIKTATDTWSFGGDLEA